MTRHFIPVGGTLALTTVLVLIVPTFSTAGDGFTAPTDPRLIVPVPIFRRHVCGGDYSVPNRRGVAIMSPIESPDRDCSIVGGKPQCVPYYPDYVRPGKHGPRLGIPDNGEGYCCTGAGGGSTAGVPASELPSGIDNSSGYGGYSALAGTKRLCCTLAATPHQVPKPGPAARPT